MASMSDAILALRSSFCSVHANASTSSVASPKKPVDPSIAPVRKVRNVSKSRPWSRPALTGPVAGNRLLAIRDRLISRQRSVESVVAVQ
jgi:hypothetical protein